MIPADERCPECTKPRAVCICDRVEVSPTRVRVLILQHPSEHDTMLGTAPIVTRSLPGARTIVGLSWRSLADATGEPTEPSRWPIVYGGALPEAAQKVAAKKPVMAFDRHGKLLAPSTRFEGIVVLDGTWSQAKTLWWRNPWLLRHPRIVLHADAPSAYGRLRAQSKHDHLSTLEAIGATLTGLGEDPAIQKRLLYVFRTFLQRVRDAQARAEPGVEPAPKKRAPRRSHERRGGGPLD